MHGLKRVKNRREDGVSAIPWDRLEALLAEYYAGQGYHVEHVGTGGTAKRFDGGGCAEFCVNGISVYS